MAKSKQNRKTGKEERIIQVGALVLGLIIVAGIVFFTMVNQIPKQPQERLDLDPILGNPDAPVSIIEYGAYGCGACRTWHQAGVIEEILEEFPNQVRFIYRDMPIIMPEWSQEMAELAQCALDQGQEAFWLMHDALYIQTIQGGTSQIQMIQFAGELGLERSDLRSCVEAKTHYYTVRYDMERPEAQGIISTPTWFINGQQVFSASPEILRELIRAELANLGL